MKNPPSTLSLSEKSVLQNVKDSYLIWVSIVPHLQKTARFTIGVRIENKLLDLLELSYTAYFTKNEKAEKIAQCIFCLDIIKFLISTAWEAKFVSNKQYEYISLKLSENGKIFWGWKNSIEKKNPAKI